MNSKNSIAILFCIILSGCGVKGNPQPKSEAVVDFTKIYGEKVHKQKPKDEKKDKSAKDKVK